MVSGAAGDAEPLPDACLPTFKISFSKLYNAICEQINTDETTLLLYLLTFENVEFMSYIMARCDIETLVSELEQSTAPPVSCFPLDVKLLISRGSFVV